ncbi:MAG: DnaA ATPase domain-containing protein [Thermogutta sp.]
MAKDDKDIMSALRRALADRVGNERYALWFGPRTRFAWDGTDLSVFAPNPFFREWIRTVFACAIEEACQSTFGWVPKITFRCADENQGGENHLNSFSDLTADALTSKGTRDHVKSRTAAHQLTHPTTDSAESLPLFRFATRNEVATPRVAGGEVQTCSTTQVSQGLTGKESTPQGEELEELSLDSAPAYGESPATAATEKAICLRLSSAHVDGDEQPVAARMDRQGAGKTLAARKTDADSAGRRGAIFQSQLTPTYDLKSFIVGDCNRLAFAAADAVVRILGTYSPLVLHGPSGVGKTHLLEGIWRAVKQRHPRIAAIYLSAEQFTTAYVDALHKGGIPVFRQKYRGLQLFLLDDLHFLVGKRQTQIELLYTIDSLLKSGCQIVCAVDRPPCEIRELSPELISRLEGGVVCRIDPPDLGVRIQIVERIVEEARLSLSSEVQAWVAERFTKNVRQVIGAVRRLEAAAKALRRPLDLALAEEILSDMLGQASCQVNLPDIEREVCRVFDLPEGALRANRKDREITYPRMLAMWLARKYTRANLVEIGRYFGKRSHATVISAHKKVESWVREGFRLISAKGERSVNETLKELERRLQTG